MFLQYSSPLLTHVHDYQRPLQNPELFALFGSRTKPSILNSSGCMSRWLGLLSRPFRIPLCSAVWASRLYSQLGFCYNRGDKPKSKPPCFSGDWKEFSAAYSEMYNTSLSFTSTHRSRRPSTCNTAYHQCSSQNLLHGNCPISGQTVHKRRVMHEGLRSQTLASLSKAFLPTEEAQNCS